jgi:hypothetical protein
MRLFWMDRLFSHAHAVGRVSTSFVPVFPVRAAHKSYVVPVPVRALPRGGRLCLGIGDGRVRRQ